MNNANSDTASLVNEYIEKTGQTKQELLAGGEAYGYTFIFNELLPQALKENKKIVWKTEPEKGIGAMSYTLQDI